MKFKDLTSDKFKSEHWFVLFLMIIMVIGILNYSFGCFQRKIHDPEYSYQTDERGI